MLETLPGAAPFAEPLARRLVDAVRAKGPGYGPRTHHLVDGGRPRSTNRLVLERSPYLLQHAHNPVSWWAWGDEPFEEARRTGRPVFLSSATRPATGATSWSASRSRTRRSRGC